MVSVNGSGFAYSSGYLSLNAAVRTAEMELSRERRRRRILMRRRSNNRVVPDVVVGDLVAADGIPLEAPVNGGGLVGGFEGMQIGVPMAPPSPQVEAERGNPEPVIGAIAVSGRMRYMEDEICIQTKLCSPAINGFYPVHYFGVFDGHGGAHFSNTCKLRMHQILKEQLTGVSMQPYPMWPGYSTMSFPVPGIITDESVLQETWKTVMSHCFARTETVAHRTCPCGSVGFRCRHRQGYVTFSGTTAVTVVLTNKHIVTANCGDSRAVLYRGGRVVPLSFDHKGDRSDEKARVESSGGRIVRTDTYRVEGVLSMTRAIGDRFLKPLVISEPEVTFIRRSEEDEFIILASDGFWDVVSTQMAGEVTRECLVESDDDDDVNMDHDGLGNGPSPGFGPSPLLCPSKSALAAGLLCRLAVARKSNDNISVIVVDLKRVVSGDRSDDDDNEVMDGN
ncbi:hypothetical protein CASFOL_041854 [Castilleja foliolosa]|uniref:protein-serine/threonine phosphatase n=1 Tax=Castilleja foliolosa TaxID=1961234 RepID=A0ABD3BA63_9LAMI